MRKSFWTYSLIAVLAAILLSAGPVSAQIDQWATVPPGDLEIQKAVNTRLVYAGDNIEFTLYVINNSDNVINDLIVDDTLSIYAEYLDGSASDGGSYDPSTRVLSWDLGSIYGGDTTSLTFTMSTDPDVLDTLVVLNRAQVYNPRVSVKSNWTITWVKPIFQSVLSIDKSADQYIAKPGDTVSFVIRVENSGNIAANDIELIDTLPVETEAIENTITNGGMYDPALRIIRWSAIRLEPGAGIDFGYDAVISSSILDTTELDNIAVIPLPNDSSISDTSTITVTPEPPVPIITVDKTADRDTVGTGETIGYTITVENSGTGAGNNIHVTDVVPAGTELVAGSITENGQYDSGTNGIIWRIETLPAGSSVDLKFNALVTAEYDSYTTIDNRADLYFEDESDFDTTSTVYRPVFKPVLDIKKVAEKEIIEAGELPHFIITVENTGNASAYDLIIEDTLPGKDNYVWEPSDGGIIDPSQKKVTWNIDEVAPTETITLDLSVMYPESIPWGNYDDTVWNYVFMYHGEDTYGDTASVIIEPHNPELEIIKDVDKAEAKAGDTLVYTITAKNTGNADAINVRVIDLLPDRVSVIDDPIGADGVYDPTANTITWTIANLGAMSDKIVKFRVEINDLVASGTVLENIALYDHPDINISDTAKTTIIQAELGIEKSVDKPIARAKDTLNYTLVIENSGNAAAENVPVVDTLPAFMTLIDDSITQGGVYDPDSREISWMIEGLPVEGSRTFNFSATVDDNAVVGSAIINTGIIDIPDHPIMDTATTIVDEQIGEPVLTIDKTADKDTTSNGDIITYTLTVNNSGGADAANVNISDVIPKYTNYVDNSANMGGVYDAEKNQLSWTIEKLPIKSKVELQFQARVDYTGYGNSKITNIGQIILKDSTVADTAISTVLGYPDDFDLHIDKKVSRETARAGDALTYTITVNNTGEGDAVDFNVFDAVPPEIRIVRSTVQNGGTFDPDTGLITWPVDILASGSTKEFTFDAVIRNSVEPQISVMNIGRAEIADIAIADTVYTEILPPVELPFTIVKSVDSTVARRNSVIEYTVAIANTSSEPLGNIVFWDDIPEWTAYVEGSVTGSGRYDGEINRVTWDWSDASIAPGHTINLSFKVKIDAEAPKDYKIPNYAVAEIDFPDIPAKAASPALIDTVKSNTVETIVNVQTGTQDDPVIVKAVNFSEAAPGNTLHYTVSVTNPGPDPVNPLIVSDVIPDMTTYVPGSATHGGVYTSADRILGWTYGPIAADETVEFEFDAVIDAGASDGLEIHNTAHLVAPIFAPSNEVVTTVRVGEFFLIKRVSHATAYPGDTLTYTLIYNNATGIDQSNVVISDPLQLSLQYIPGSATDGGTGTTNNVAWNFVNIPAGTIDSVQFKAVIDTETAGGTSIVNFGLVSGNSIPMTLSNEVQTTVLSLPEANIRLVKNVSPSIAVPGDTIQYAIGIRNQNGGAIDNIVVTDNTPDHFTYVDGSAFIVIGGTDSSSVSISSIDPLTFEFGRLEQNTNAAIAYKLVIDDDAPFNRTYTNSAVLTGVDFTGRDVRVGPVSADVYVGESVLRITKSTNNASGTIGSVIPFTLTIENLSDGTLYNVTVHDSMSAAFDYIEGSSYINGAVNVEPLGTNPYYWLISEIGPGETITLTYSTQLTTAAGPGSVENVAWAEGLFGTATVRTENVVAKVDVFATFIPGAIRGRLIVDCDGDKMTEYPHWIEGVDIYLEDGSMSRSNEMGMFYFNTVKAGTHIAAVDTRDLQGRGYRLAEGEPSSVFVHVNEAGETYVYFRVCPMISIHKEAGLIPKIKVTKTARLDREGMNDSSGVMVDYEIKIQANEWYSKTLLKVVDSFPEETRLIIHDAQPIIPNERNNVLTYEVNIEEKHFNQSVYYSLEDLAPGIRRFLTNKIYLEGDVYLDSLNSYPIKSYPTEVQVGPFKRIPGRDIQVNVIGAYFESAKARLLPEAFPVLTDIADTMKKYEDADIRVVGHCDWRPIDTPEFPSNWELSEARAKSVADWLVDSAGIALNRIEYEGLAATHPVDTSWTMKGMDRNRRVEVFVKSFKEGKIDLSQITEDKWSSYTVLEIEPIDIDTLFKMPSRPIETGLADTWEVYLSIDAEGKTDIDNVAISDEIPAGAEYVEGSADYAGQKLTPEIDEDGTITFHIDRLIPDSEAVLTYRIKTSEGTKPEGGGKAVLTVEESGKTVNSNPVYFEPSGDTGE